MDSSMRNALRALFLEIIFQWEDDKLTNWSSLVERLSVAACKLIPHLQSNATEVLLENQKILLSQVNSSLENFTVAAQIVKTEAILYQLKVAKDYSAELAGPSNLLHQDFHDEKSDDGERRKRPEIYPRKGKK